MSKSEDNLQHLELPDIPGLNPDIIEVVYALPDYQHIFKVRLSDFKKPDITIAEIIEHSGVLEQYPEIDLTSNSVGVNSEIKQLSDRVKKYDRIEIYRPLTIDPTDARRLRAKRQGKNKVEK